MRVALEDVEVARVVQKGVRAHVVRLTRVLGEDAPRELVEAGLAKPVEAGGVHVVVVRAHHRVGHGRLLRRPLAPEAARRARLLTQSLEPAVRDGVDVGLHPEGEVVLGLG